MTLFGRLDAGEHLGRRLRPSNHPIAFWCLRHSILLTVLLLTLPSLANAAGNAYAVDDADIGKPGSCQNEAWVSTATSRDFVGVESPACVVNLGIPVELAGLFQRTLTGPDWATVLGAQAKIVPYNTDKLAVSFSLGVARDITDGREIVTANFPVTIKFGKDFRIHTNVGYLYDGRVSTHYATGGVGFDWDFAEKFSLMGEVYLQQGPSIGISTVTQPRTQLGLQYSPVSTVDILAIYGQNISGRSAHWLTIGLTVRSE